MKKISLTIAIIVFSSGFLSGQIVKLFSKEDISKDIDFLVSDIENIHPNPYHSISKDELSEKAGEIKNALPGSLSIPEVYIRLNELLASYQEGHTYLRPPTNEIGSFLKFPFKIRILPKEKKLVIFNSEVDSLKRYIGSIILSINGISSDSLISILMKTVSGELPPFRYFMIETNFEYAVYSVFRSPEYFNLGLLTDEKQTLHRFKSTRYVPDKPETDYSFRIIKEDLGYMRMHRMNDYNNFIKFCRSAFDELKKKKITKLIIDFRGNQGGDSQVGEELIKYLSNVPFTQWDKVLVKVSSVSRSLYNYPSKRDTIAEKDLSKNLVDPFPPQKRYSGKFIILADKGTYSAAGEAVWCLRHYNLCPVVGEETSGLGIHYGNVIKRTLPVTGLTYYTSHMKWYQVGADENSTYGLKPDYEIIPTLADIKNHRDPALDYAINLMNKE